jgi:hypothetical protein
MIIKESFIAAVMFTTGMVDAMSGIEQVLLCREWGWHSLFPAVAGIG